MLICNNFLNTSLNNKGWLELFLESNTINFKEKMFFNSISFLDHRHFFIAFVSQSLVEAAVCSFVDYKLIGWELFLSYVNTDRMLKLTFFNITGDFFK